MKIIKLNNEIYISIRYKRNIRIRSTYVVTIFSYNNSYIIFKVHRNFNGNEEKYPSSGVVGIGFQIRYVNVLKIEVARFNTQSNR